jgi:hypothetical protein
MPSSETPSTIETAAEERLRARPVDRSNCAEGHCKARDHTLGDEFHVAMKASLVTLEMPRSPKETRITT